MTLVQSIVLSFVQGIAEFLPISSSGHLNLAQYFLNIEPSLTLDIFLNTATFVSVLFFFRKKVPYFIKNLPYIIIGSIPAVVVGLFFKDQIDSIFAKITLLPFFFLITSGLVFSTSFFGKQKKKLDYKKALLIGLAQAVAILPGVSRAGSTISVALMLGLSTTEAFNFSFCLFIPASIGAVILSAKDLTSFDVFTPVNMFSFVLTVIIGLIALNILKKVLTNRKYWYFSYYTLILAITVFLTL
jgi:undecaprenyl-diphosphatase